MPEHISDRLISDFDAALGEAIRQVDQRETEKATVSLTFTVGRDKDGDMLVAYQAKDGRKRAGEWRPDREPRLPLDDPLDEALEKAIERLDGQTVTGRGGTTATIRVNRRAATGI